ncbi:MAG: ABC transporter permease subunit [Clostridiales bacterium]|nr:ABC transporter permease subunit [Clostridiales bacterium]
MLAIFKRELLSYFKSPVGYVAMALFSFLSGFIFVSSFSRGSISIASELVSLRSFFLVLIPVVTMGLLAEDKKRGTDIIYYTSPIKLSSVVLGKFLAAFCLFVIMFVNVIVHIICTKIMGGKIDAGVFGSAVVFFILVALYCAIGIFASSISDSQIVAAIVSFVLILLVQLLPTIGSFVASALVSLMNLFNKNLSSDEITEIKNSIVSAFSWLDPMERTDSMRLGIFNLASIIFCLSFCGFFLFLTYRILEKKRWSQS